MAMIDVGGYRLAVDCSGSGPLVVFIAALGEPASRWVPVVECLTEPATTVIYDRGGIGRSDGAPDPAVARPYSSFADEVARLLDGIGDRRPATVVGHSFGCLIGRVFARRYPRRVSGIVLAEASQPQLSPWDGDDSYQRDGGPA
jgi:pimeloyl-ACP methyl ester carboxylesterase